MDGLEGYEKDLKLVKDRDYIERGRIFLSVVYGVQVNSESRIKRTAILT
jgi:hypothetical protein